VLTLPTGLIKISRFDEQADGRSRYVTSRRSSAGRLDIRDLGKDTRACVGAFRARFIPHDRAPKPSDPSHHGWVSERARARAASSSIAGRSPRIETRLIGLFRTGTAKKRNEEETAGKGKGRKRGGEVKIGAKLAKLVSASPSKAAPMQSREEKSLVRGFEFSDANLSSRSALHGEQVDPLRDWLVSRPLRSRRLYNALEIEWRRWAGR
jgi:hypothetical protein